MKIALLLVALAWAATPGVDGPRLQLAVTRGRVVVERPAEDGRGVPPVIRRPGDDRWDLDAPARLAAPALSAVELRWPGRASATLRGASQAWVEEGQGLRLGRFASAEVEVRRGRLRLEVVDLCSLEAEKAALGLQALVDGRVEVVHRGGAPLRLHVEGAQRTLRAGERVRLGPSGRAAR